MAVTEPFRPVAWKRLDCGEMTVCSAQDTHNGILPEVYPEWLGDRSFRSVHGCRFAYGVGAMARGITTAEMVIAAQRAGFIAFFGAAGLDIPSISNAIDRIQSALGPDAQAWGSNLIHSPQSPESERATIDLYLRKHVRRVSASAFMDLSPEIVRYVAAGMSLAPDGTVIRRNHVFAKLSNPRLAGAFMSPAPDRLVDPLVAAGDITPDQARCIKSLPVACDIIAEADSGGHTDNRPAAALFSSMVETRARVCATHGISPETIRIGLAGGIGTPASLAAAYGMGAAFAWTGSVKQATLESGLSDTGKALLAGLALDDVAMAPAADMFERGVKVQVVRRGTFFPMRADRLYALYRAHDAIEELSADDMAFVETCLGEPIAAAWEKTAAYLSANKPKDFERAASSGKAKMGLLFRRYLFQCAQWARDGDGAHQTEYQIWCGPAQGAFNDWVHGSNLAPMENRTVAGVGMALLRGATRITRAQQLRSAGFPVPVALFHVPAGDVDGMVRPLIRGEAAA